MIKLIMYKLEKNGFRNRNIWVKIIGGGAVLAAWIFSIFFPAPNSLAMLSPAELYAEYEKISFIKNSEPNDEIKKFFKPGVQSISRRYSMISKDAVIQHYTGELKKNGWIYLSSTSDGINWGSIFCKQHTQATILILPSEAQTNHFEFFLSGNGKSRYECP